MRSVLIDIDHTISDAFWRDGFANAPWDTYHAASVNDHPIQDMAEMLEALAASFNIVGITARPEKWRKLTMDWLLKNMIEMDELLMREDDNFRPAPELKLELAKARFPDLKEVAFILDDREDVVAAFKGIGITALQVHAPQRRVK